MFRKIISEAVKPGFPPLLIVIFDYIYIKNFIISASNTKITVL